MDLLKKPLFAAIFSSLMTILVFHLVYTINYQRIEVQNSERTRPLPLSARRGSVDLDARNCDLFEAPLNPTKRTPQILIPGRVRVVNYKTFPDDGNIQCVEHRAAVSQTKICIIDPKKDLYISARLKTSAGWEPQITKAFRRELKECPDCQVLDFGANLGVYALIGASADRRVFAVEPMHENLLHFVKSVRTNGWEKRITIITNTLADVYEEMEFWRPWTNAGGSIARKVGEPAPDKKLYDGPYDKVASVQIDNLLEVIDFNKAIMKIDIEGYEPRAFTGASRFFAQMDIRVIFMEWSNKGNGDPLALKMAVELTRLGYVVHDTNIMRLPLPDAQTVKTWPFDIIWKKLH